jgi:PAS domain S-box-containing protein
VTSLVGGLCDGCAITVVPGATEGISIARHRSRDHEHLLASVAAVTDPCKYTFQSSAEARATLPPAYHPLIDRLGLSALAVIAFPPRSPIAGVVTVMRDGHSEPFEAEDLATIQMCIEYAAMAFDNGLRMEAERTARTQLQTILEQLPLSILVADQSGRLTHINRTALELVPTLAQARTLEELGMRAPLQNDQGSPLASEDMPLARALRGETVRGLELALRPQEGEPRHLRLSAVPLRDARGEVAAAVVAYEDVTSEHAAAVERARAAEFQEYVLGIVSHDLRTPIQTITMGIDGIKELVGDKDRLLRLADLMESTTRRMRGIIDQLLDVTRARVGGGIPLVPAETALDDVVRTVLREISLAYPAVRFEPKLTHVCGSWDPDRIAQVVSNLVGNAIQHGPPSSPVWVETDREGDDAFLRVRNASSTGVALTQEQLARFFRPFRTSRQSAGGLGLGLYITCEIVRAHHGRIRVESDPRMTTFVVQLPISAHGRANAHGVRDGHDSA